jgi:hypothetical protein
MYTNLIFFVYRLLLITVPKDDDLYSTTFFNQKSARNYSILAKKNIIINSKTLHQ